MVSISRFIVSLWRKLLILVFVVLLVALGLAYGAWRYFNYWLDQPLAIPAEGYVYELKPGQSLGHLAAQLGADGVLEHPVLLRVYGRLQNAHKIHAGEYRFDVGATPKSLVSKLLKGEVILYQVTIVEGWTYAQALDAVGKSPYLRHLLTGKDMEAQKVLLGLEDMHPEGWFFPDTYSFPRNTTDVDLLRQAHQKMRHELERAWENRAGQLPYKTPYEALIMASIIERETGHHAERDQIAGVFVRRLQQGMRLQTDPTVIYGMGEKYQGRISRKHLQEATAYNTYVIDGLPPTPIALPSAASIRAALHPADGNALYFVAKGDGTSEFSATLSEHNAAVRRYQLKRRADYRSSPPSPQSTNQTP
ncbi:endolytic transglycosylase MltG [Cellvibrio japonicus]|uniref:Endolytic murein transglycosylase n=1 Tax=Cellvibrio japonicus (strain Ueda107) TaxID=498211 RepID=B3PEV5_CELJU|nr:endolytic transglycosylase MltG [Cellvibrio japonicus]ACE86155.1 Uncharacterized BCR, YceG family [Cellvibrio japonicus Ueda107]